MHGQRNQFTSFVKLSNAELDRHQLSSVNN